ncbi:Branched-chain amino acid aminotransferase/4-amino-4-deoxychorismate lyase family protein [Flavobacterium indicum GPTSA100-9 = DSM 17447]|uniref:branched-chain-amino-acid transaminase n=1 Tax=Flavobacterium indicum (strain DSM 17447 / CIP 109464 / GPTSA100-9) TaxID=1094466 RepID=H8XSR7_FLAIG|nr:aminotransferase class IV [Flavobacterium indicum]CCG53459.1 Branched-chain amino acid aminotransferase/4-amino-4-deoxychorismate lyase family protein [Flavobacterium indicum GPTSA100-9 = DSM 17447]
MINFNGTLQDNSALYIETNRGFLFGDAVFETVKIVNSKIVFLEEHYLRLMASMRICRMEIPMLLTMEYFEEQIVSLLQALKFVNARVRFTVFRDSEGYYTPNSNDVKFVIMANELNNTFYSFSNEPYEVELFKDFHLSKHLLSTIKTNNKMIHTLAGIFAKENDYQNCLLINEDKNIVEAIQANIFMKMGDVISTPPISEGCQNGILRKQIIKLISKNTNIRFEEKPISPFDLQKADELFLTNVIIGIQPITKYRKKMYVNDFATQLLEELNCLLN